MRNLEQQFNGSYPVLVQLVTQCLHNTPQTRPSSQQLLGRLQLIKHEMYGKLVAANATLENKKRSLIADKTRITEENLHDKLHQENEKAKLTEEIHRVNTEKDKLTEDIHRVNTEKDKLTEDIHRVNTEKDKLTQEIHRSATENHQLVTENNQLNIDNKQLRRLYEECKAKTCSLEKEVEELKNQLEKSRDIPSQRQVSI